jgi:hypothetical protein
MESHRIIDTSDIRTVRELKKVIIAHALVSGNTIAFHELIANVKEFAKGGDDAEVNETLLDHLRHLLPDSETADSAEFKSALEIVEQLDIKGDFIPAVLLEITAREATVREKFAYAEDAYRLLGIKKEIMALYAQRGEQFLREGKPSHAALSFLVAASIDQPIGPNFQYLGPKLHEQCLRQPKTCVTNSSVEELINTGIQFLLSHNTFAERLIAAAPADQKRSVLGTLAKYRDENINELIANLRKAVETYSAIRNGKPDDYSAVSSLLLGRATATGQAWQYLREFSYEHPIAALCVCIRPIGDKQVLVPVTREGKSLLEFLLPPEMLSV